MLIHLRVNGHGLCRAHKEIRATMDIPLPWELEETIRENNGHTPIMGISEINYVTR